MKELGYEQRLALATFHDQLSMVIGPDDMFPPDESGDRSPLPDPVPAMPTSEILCLENVCSQLAARNRRRQLAVRAGQIVTQIDSLVGV